MSDTKQEQTDSGRADSGKAEGGGFLARAWAALVGKGGGRQQTHAHVVNPEAKVLVVRYVDGLLCRLLQRQEPAITLRTADRLPEVGVPIDASLTYLKVVNRLKVLCGLYPVDCPKPTDARFRYEWQGRRYEVRVSFEDRGSASNCRITVSDSLGGS